jgi:hypothetical protein
MQSKTRFDVPKNRAIYGYELPPHTINYWQAVNQAEYHIWISLKEHRPMPTLNYHKRKATTEGHKAQARYFLTLAKHLRLKPCS